MKLPAEIRNLIYDHSIDVSAAQNIIDRYYQGLRNTQSVSTIEAPLIYSKCPAIFLINRQIYAEASVLVKKCELTFKHGLLDLLTIKDFAPVSLFRNVSSITVNDTGHPLLKSNILTASWMGYVTLIEQLADILKDGHRLKNLTISLADKELIPHVTTCMTADYACGFRDTALRACEALRVVRNVGNVTLAGFPQPLAQQLKARMESAPVNFLDLPRELRDYIYAEALDWSDISKQLVRAVFEWTDKTSPPPYPKRSTPTILLLNKQVTAEALPVLRAKPLTIVCPRDHGMQRQDQVPNMLHFITRSTLAHVQHLVLKLESWEWIHSLDYVLPVFAATSLHPSYPIILGHRTSLKTVHFHFEDDLKRRFLADANQHYPDHQLHTSLGGLAKMRGLKKITFSGDLPACYTAPMAQIMQMPPSVDDANLPPLMAIKGTGTVVSVDDGDV